MTLVSLHSEQHGRTLNDSITYQDAANAAKHDQYMRELADLSERLQAKVDESAGMVSVSSCQSSTIADGPTESTVNSEMRQKDGKATAEPSWNAR